MTDLLASAIAGRPLTVAEQEPGEPAWTDGAVLYLAAGEPDRLAAIAVQASLLAGGGLAPGIVRRLRRGEVRRYLAVEGGRALLANAAVLPPAVLGLLDGTVRTGSPAESLALARSRVPIADPPACFGTIRPGVVRADSPPGGGAHRPRRGGRVEEFDEPEEYGDDVPDPFSSPIGGGGGLGKLLRRLLGVGRGGGAGEPGAEAVTHRTRSGRIGNGTVVSAAVDRAEYGFGARAGGFGYPEWDVHRRDYRPDWCTVREVEPTPAEHTEPAAPDPRMRAALARVGLGLERRRRQPQGDDLDLDALVTARVDALAGAAAGEFVHLDTARTRRDLSVLILLDVSGSVAGRGTGGDSIHRQQRAVALALAGTLHELGDRLALYGFRSAGRSAVQLLPVKRFHEPFGGIARRRLHGLEPGAYSRLGAAIRHGTALLRDGGGTPRPVLVVLSDGLAYDHGYERGYGAADASRALAEARRAGIGALCLTVGAPTADDELRRVFGTAAHAAVRDQGEVARIIGPLFRAAATRNR
ncbi:nitric oxide reductase activation protein NorD [Nocardia sp. NPDC057227]|uniref:nitric oxide reductase activation protein NorD n=1 Tax=Nocardia sp. NPDC057227 TaxID=3346056 RepID=UPI00362A950E